MSGGGNSAAAAAAGPAAHGGPSPVFFVVLAGLFAIGTAQAFLRGAHTIHAKGGGLDWDVLGVLVAAGMSIALYSFLYADNPYFKAAEHLFVGVGLGYQMVAAWFEYIKPEAYKQLLRYAVRPDVPGRPEWALIPALVLSAMLLARFIPRLGWLARIPVAFIVGLTAATQVPNQIQAAVLRQVEQTIFSFGGGAPWDKLLGQTLVLVGVVCVLLYFFFSVEHKGAVGFGSKIGMWFLMISFGASFGYTVMGRMALLVGNLRFLLGEWLKIPLPT